MALPAHLIRLLLRLVGQRVGVSGQGTLRSISYLFGVDVLVTIMTFPVSTWLIRRLGPEQFGVTNLVISVAQIPLVLLLVGLHAAASQNLAAAPTERRAILGTAWSLLCVTTVVVLSVGYVLNRQLSSLLGVEPMVFLWSLAYAGLLGQHALAQSALAGLKRFRQMGVFHAGSALVFVVAALGVLLTTEVLGYTAYLWLNVLWWSAFSALSFASLVPHAGALSSRWVRPLLRFGRWHMLGSMASFLLLGSIDSLMLNAYLGPGAVGVYGAYYAVFNIFMSRIARVLTLVVVPTAAGHDNPSGLLGPAFRVYARLGWVAVPALFILTAGLFRVYGQAYPFVWTTALLMSFSVFLHGAVGLSTDFLVARGLEGLRQSTLSTFVAGVVNVTGNVFLIPMLGIEGVILASIVASGVMLALRYRALRAPSSGGTRSPS